MAFNEPFITWLNFMFNQAYCLALLSCSCSFDPLQLSIPMYPKATVPVGNRIGELITESRSF